MWDGVFLHSIICKYTIYTALMLKLNHTGTKTETGNKNTLLWPRDFTCEHFLSQLHSITFRDLSILSNYLRFSRHFLEIQVFFTFLKIF